MGLRLRFWVLHVLEKCTVVILVLAGVVLEIRWVNLRLSGSLSLKRDSIWAGVEEHGIVAIELLL